MENIQMIIIFVNKIRKSTYKNYNILKNDGTQNVVVSIVVGRVI